MSGKTIAKSIYIFGMGLFGNCVGDVFGRACCTNDVTRTLVKGAVCVTGAYTGLIIANNLDEMIANAINELENDVEVNHNE